MFIVTLRCDELEITSAFHNYEYALIDLNSLIREAEKSRANGFIKKYSVELRKES